MKLKHEFSAEKNQQLIKERGISFEDIIAAIEASRIRDNHSS